MKPVVDPTGASRAGAVVGRTRPDTGLDTAADGLPTQSNPALIPGSARQPVVGPTHDVGVAPATIPQLPPMRRTPIRRNVSTVAVEPAPTLDHAEALRSPIARFRLRRRIAAEERRVRTLIDEAEHEVVLVHSGESPPKAQVRQLVEALDRPVDRGAGSRGRGRNIVRADEYPAIAHADTGGNVSLTRIWQQFVRDGAHAVTLGTATRRVDAALAARSADPEHDDDETDDDEPATSRRRSTQRTRTIERGIAEAGPDKAPYEAFVIHRERAQQTRHEVFKTAIHRRSWWTSVIVVTLFAVLNLIDIITGAATTNIAPGSRAETITERWMAAAGLGTVNNVGLTPLPGSSLWPAIARPVLELFGTAGLQVMSLCFTIVAIGTSAAAGSRLFGRWAARATAIVLSAGLWLTGIATSTTPAPLAMAAIGVCVLAISLVEHHDRRSWILLAGLSATVAVVASYPSIVFVLILSLMFTMLRGRHGVNDSRTFNLVVAAGLLAWFLPTRQASVRYITETTWDGEWSEVGIDTLILGLAVVAVSLLVGSSSKYLRHRVMVLGTSLLAVPVAHLMSGGSLEVGHDASIALTLVAPAVGGAIAFRIAQIRFGHNVEPDRSARSDILVVDPSTGSIRRRLVRYSNRQVRVAASAVVISSLWYLPWAMVNIDWANWWIAVPFLLANGCMVGTALLSAYNNWRRAVPIPVDVAPGHEPLVGVIVPTYAEPLHMVLNTVRSVFDQDWPAHRLRVVVSDDAHDDVMRDAIAAFARRLPEGSLLYNRPPKKGDPERRGESKSGNLNSAVLLLDDCDFVETRDSDDLVGSSNFLRATVGQLLDDPGLGFMQTIKETKTSEGDPFNNNEPFFYRGTMLARNADYAIFPCGSGLVWRRRALKSIDDFPVWNLVEDLHSGVLGLRQGWRGLYVPIVGAFAQHSPEDVANVFKQRGTWALDTTRLLLFDRFRRIPWKMRLHFLEQAIFYLLSFPLLVLVVVPGLGLFFDRFPLDTDATTYAVHFWGFALSIELMLLSLAAAQPPGSLWRSRLSWIGMAPIYARAAIRALRYGPYKKPAYKVTRKTDDYQWYVKLVRAHWMLLVGTVIGVLVALLRDNFLTELDLGSLYWGVVAIVGLGSFLRLSWFGVDARERLRLRFAPLIAWIQRVRGIEPTDDAATEGATSDGEVPDAAAEPAGPTLLPSLVREATDDRADNELRALLPSLLRASNEERSTEELTPLLPATRRGPDVETSGDPVVDDADTAESIDLDALLAEVRSHQLPTEPEPEPVEPEPEPAEPEPVEFDPVELDELDALLAAAGVGHPTAEPENVALGSSDDDDTDRLERPGVIGDPLLDGVPFDRWSAEHPSDVVAAAEAWLDEMLEQPRRDRSRR